MLMTLQQHKIGQYLGMKLVIKLTMIKGWEGLKVGSSTIWDWNGSV